MIFHFFVKLARCILIALIVALVVFCILFAILQSKWAKDQIKEKMISDLKKAGITAHIAGLEGQPPFTWTLKEVELKLNDSEELKFFNLKFRFAIFPLLKGRIAINYLKVETAEYFFVPNEELAEPFTIATFKQNARKFFEKTSLPFQIALDHFGIDSLSLINNRSGSHLKFGIEGVAAMQKDLKEFALDFRLISPDLNKTYLEASLKGSQKKDFIESQLKINTAAIPSFLDLGVDGSVEAHFSLKGPWTSWKEIFYDLPLSQSPLKGAFKGTLIETSIQSCPIMDRDWKFKTLFTVNSGQNIFVENFQLLSNLIQIKGKANLIHSLEESKVLFAFSTPDLSLFSPLASLPISGSAKGKAVFQEGDFKISFQTQNLELERFAANTLRGIIKGSVEKQQWEAETKLSTSDASIPFETSFALEYIPQTLLSIKDWNFNTSDAAVHGYLDYNIADDLYEGSFFAQIEHLDTFNDLLKEKNLHGKVALEIALSYDDLEQRVKGALVGKNLRCREILMDDLSLSAEIEDLFHSPQGRFNLLAEKIYTPTFYLDRLNFGTLSDEVHWPFFLDIEGRIDSPFQCYAKGFWQNETPLFTLELTQLYGDLSQTPFALQYPFELEWGFDYLNLSPFDFKIGNGGLFATFELSPVRSLGSWELKHFPLEVLSCIRPRFALSGFVSGSGFIDSTQENMEGVFNAALEEAGILHFGKKEPFRAKGSIQAHLNHQICQVHTAISATDAQFLDFNASLPIVYNLYPFSISIDPAKNTSAELLAEGKLQDLFDFVNLGTNYFTGLVSCRLFLSQTLSNPSLQGHLELQNGTYENYFTGINLSKIDASFEAKGDQIRLISLNAGDDKSGEASATGKIELKPDMHFPYSFEAEMRKLHALGFDMIDCDLTGPVYLTGDTLHMAAQGNLLIDEAKIQITERLPYEVPTLPVTYVNLPEHLSSRTLSNGPGFDFNIDLELTSEGNVRVEGRGLNAELEGNVHLHGTNTDIAASGALKLIKGEYIFSGKVFKLTEGEIIFKDKPTSSAYLNINGTLNMPEITITAMLRGPLMSPQLTFQSNPQKPTSSILALILFNKDIAEISHPEAIQLASTLVSLSGGAGPDVLESIRKSIGIDRLNIASSPGSDELAVQIGKYLTRGIMITLSQSATSSQVIVEIELPKNFIFQAETQEEEEGKFSLKWRKTY